MLVFVSTSILLGEVLSIQWIRDIWCYTFPTAASTALCFVLLGCAVLIRRRVPHSKWKHRLCLALIGIGLLLSGAILFQYLSGYFGYPQGDIEQIFGKATISENHVVMGRMSVWTAWLMVFSSLAMGIYFPGSASRLRQHLAQGVSSVIMIFSVILIVGYSYGSPFFYDGKTIPVALTTAVCFALLNMGLLFEGEKAWLYRLATDSSVSGCFIRWLTPWVAVILLSVGWIHSKYLDPLPKTYHALSFSVLTLLTCVVVSYIIVRVARKVEKDVTLLHEEIRRKGEAFQNIFECTGDPIFIWNPLGKFLEVNQEACKQLGYTREELLQLSSGDIDSPEFASLVTERLKRFEYESNIQFESAHLRKDGTVIPVEIRSKKIVYQGVDCILSVARDITERKKEQKALLIAKEKAEMSDRAKSEFLAMMSHEIRTPLNGVIGFADLLAGEKLEEEQQDWVSMIKQCGRQLLLLINDILDLSRIEAGRLEFENAPFNLWKIIDESIQPLYLKMREKNLTCEIHCDHRLHLVADPTRVRQVLFNLVSNAIKFTDQGSIHIRAQVVPGGDKTATVTIDVVDTGIGISPENLKKLFTPFTQVDSSSTRRYEGSGLGLVISRKIAEQMKGNLILTSKPGVGTTASFTFVAMSVVNAYHEKEKSPGMIHRNQSIQAMLIDDNPTNLKLLDILMKKITPSVDRYSSPKDALDAAAKNLYTHFFIDILMPEIDGVECMKRIRIIHPKATFIAVTANAMTESKEKYLAAGFDHYIPKPVKIELLNQIFA